jgi:hypothetical protein
MNTNSAGVLAVMDRGIAELRAGHSTLWTARDVEAMRAAVAELIEAGEDFRDCEHVAAWSHLSPERRVELMSRYSPEHGTRPVREARERFFSALAALGGNGKDAQP